jgi:hypothetical protein
MTTREREPGRRQQPRRPQEREAVDDRRDEDGIEDKSEDEREAEGGMRASEPGRVSNDRFEDLAALADDVEGHRLEGAAARERGLVDAGPDEDIRPDGMTEAELDAGRRAAKRAARPTGTPE